MFTIEIRRTFKAIQGLPAPVRENKNLPPLMPTDGFQVTMRVGLSFGDNQLGGRGWFVDTDALDDPIDYCVDHLTSRPWTETFPFRPSFENVARWTYDTLADDIPQLRYVELDNDTIGVLTRYHDPN
ncbi:6-carboxytetrahydropterin synthase [Rhodococcus sp. ACT016]|uniref:6-carboxytetrahydropterin synthase n=1 Tax=Rhodococcus sp. ACT016 TaxID=3134808 RepID=UPI003D2E3AB1